MHNADSSTKIADFLKQVKETDLLRFTTAGSVDDGKSTLIGRLLHDSKSIYEDHLSALHKDSIKAGREEVDLALLTDGLKAEREQGITIDVAYRHFSTPKRRFIIADTPGHEQYTRNMVTGASTANLAIILIDAENGVTTQSKRHGFIATLLGIPHLVVAVNKMDLVGYSQNAFESIVQEYTDFSAKLPARDLVYVPMSALRGDNVVTRSENMPWYDGHPILSHLETVHIASDHNLIDFRFPIQLVMRPNAGFRGYCGTMASGIVRVGDEVMALPSGKTSRVTRIIAGDEDVEYAFPPMAVTICIEDDLDISRGDMLAHPANQPWVARELEAMLIWMSEQPLDPNRQYIVKQTTCTVRGRFCELKYKVDPNTLRRQDADTLALNEIGRIGMSLFKPILCDEYTRCRQTGSFIVIDPQSNFTVAAGMVIDRSHRYDTVQSRNIVRHVGHLKTEDRARVLGQQPMTLWLTGLSGAGKSTIAYALEKKLNEEGRAAFVLDGDNIRHGLSRDLGFSPDDRAENIRRIAEVAKLFNEAGLIVVTSFISPYRKDRRHAREVVGEDRFIEVHVDVPISVAEERDPKGLYKKARSGEIPDFTGISAPYESPENPDVYLDTTSLSIDQAVAHIMDDLKARGVLG